ncbi:hypothetical protein KIPB_008904, partial [Kipferlia bialata]
SWSPLALACLTVSYSCNFVDAGVCIVEIWNKPVWWGEHYEYMLNDGHLPLLTWVHFLCIGIAAFETVPHSIVFIQLFRGVVNQRKYERLLRTCLTLSAAICIGIACTLSYNFYLVANLPVDATVDDAKADFDFIDDLYINMYTVGVCQMAAIFVYMNVMYRRYHKQSHAMTGNAIRLEDTSSPIPANPISQGKPKRKVSKVTIVPWIMSFYAFTCGYMVIQRIDLFDNISWLHMTRTTWVLSTNSLEVVAMVALYYPPKRPNVKWVPSSSDVGQERFGSV